MPRLLDNTANTKTVVAIVVVGGVNVGTVEVGVVGVSRGVDRTGPPVAVVRAIVERSTVDVASASKEQSAFGYQGS